MSKVKDMSLAPEGVRKIEWVQKHMPVLESIKKEYEETQPFKGITIGSCLHLEPKTINLGLTLMAGGAEVAMTGCNPLSTHDDAVAGAADLGLNVYGWREQDGRLGGIQRQSGPARNRGRRRGKPGTVGAGPAPAAVQHGQKAS